MQEGDGEENVDADKLHTGLLERLLCMKEENAAIPVTEEKLVWHRKAEWGRSSIAGVGEEVSTKHQHLEVV